MFIVNNLTKAKPLKWWWSLENHLFYLIMYVFSNFIFSLFYWLILIFNFVIFVALN